MIEVDRYKHKKILGFFEGNDAWKKLVPIRWPQVEVRQGVRRRFKNVDMTHALLVIYKTNTHIYIDFYPDHRKPTEAGVESDNLWIEKAPLSLLEAEDAPKLLKKLAGI